MKNYRYSKETNLFYPVDIDYADLPDDCIEVSEKEYQLAITARSENKPFEFDDDVLVIYDTAPNGFCTFSWTKKIWVFDGNLDELKALQRQKINELRDKVEQSGFMFLDRKIDSDKDSCLRIAISEKAGIATYWTCADNSMIWLEPKDLTSMALALRDHSNRCFEIAHLWKCYVDECANYEEVEALMAQFSEGVFHAD